MKKFSFVLGLVGLSVLGLACSGGDDPGTLPLGAANDALIADIHVLRDGMHGEPRLACRSEAHLVGADSRPGEVRGATRPS